MPAYHSGVNFSPGTATATVSSCLLQKSGPAW
jgi:hypothetical protein